jgi:hypothetical protein
VGLRVKISRLPDRHPYLDTLLIAGRGPHHCGAAAAQVWHAVTYVCLLVRFWPGSSTVPG